MLPSTTIWPITITPILLIYITQLSLYYAKNRSNSFGIWLDQFIPQTHNPLQRFAQFKRYTSRINKLKHILIHVYMGLIFYSVSYSLLTQNIHSNGHNFNILFHSIQVLTTISYFITSLSDPGLVKCTQDIRNSLPNSDQIQNEASSPLIPQNPNLLQSFSFLKTHKYSYLEPVEIDSDDAPVSFCWSCNHIRPIRSKHDDCIDACVAVFDHYNLYIGNSIGAKNRRYFLLFCLFDTIFHFLSFHITINILNKYRHNNYGGIMEWAIMIINGILISIMSITDIGLLIWHTYLISTNQTTWQIIRPSQTDVEIAEALNKLILEFVLRPGRARRSTQSTVDVVNGFIKDAQLQLPNEENCYYDIPRFVNKICIDYYNDPEYFDGDIHLQSLNKVRDFDEGYKRNWIQLINGYKPKEEWLYGLRCVSLRNVDV